MCDMNKFDLDNTHGLNSADDRHAGWVDVFVCVIVAICGDGCCVKVYCVDELDVSRIDYDVFEYDLVVLKYCCRQMMLLLEYANWLSNCSLIVWLSEFCLNRLNYRSDMLFAWTDYCWLDRLRRSRYIIRSVWLHRKRGELLDRWWKCRYYRIGMIKCNDHLQICHNYRRTELGWISAIIEQQ